MKNMGLWGEDKAVEFLKVKNYTILVRNYHSRFGEIDIIARKQNTIIFVEVKTRKNTAFGFPAEFVDYQKQQKIMKTAQLYINDNFNAEFDYRFDIIEVFHYDDNKVKFNHLKGAFEL
ncbi:YraN family protein [Megamonas funiformis]|uniref:YraN family protein n=1 Tax=Megamonas funiformis TaxID=437897 RepID=UPI00241CA9CB|nr:YraN family protein [Megamonas funiformis]